MPAPERSPGVGHWIVRLAQRVSSDLDGEQGALGPLVASYLCERAMRGAPSALGNDAASREAAFRKRCTVEKSGSGILDLDFSK